MPHRTPSRPWPFAALSLLVAIGVAASGCVSISRGGEAASPMTTAGSPIPSAATTIPSAATTLQVESPAPDPASTPVASSLIISGPAVPGSVVPSPAPPSPDISSSPAPDTGLSGPTTSGSGSSSRSTASATQLRIGYISLDESRPYVRAVSEGIRVAAERAGIDLVACDPGWTRDAVVACARELAAAGVSGVISFQPFGDLADDICAATGGAPTVGVVFDQGSCQVSQLRIDQRESGRLAGDAVGRYAAERWDCQVRAYVSLESSDADPDGRTRMQGYRDGYRAHCPLPAETRALDDAQFLLTAKTQLGRLLEEVRGKPIVVVGLNEDAILGAMEAAADAGRADHLWYSGQLADPSIRRHIACDEHYIASVAQFPERFGSAIVPTLVSAVAGEDVPSVLEAHLELVTAANVRALFPETSPCDE